MPFFTVIRKNKNIPFLRGKSKFRNKWLSKLGYHGNVNVDIHVPTTSNVPGKCLGKGTKLGGHS